MPALFYAIAGSIMVSLKFDDIRKLEQRFSNAKEIKTETLGPELRVEALKNFENVISQLHAKAALDPALLEHLLQFGTVFRRSMDTELLTHVSGVFRALEFEVKQGEVVGLSPKLNWIIFEGLRRCITFKEFQELKGSFLCSDEKQKIDSFLQNFREVTKEEVVAFFKDYKKKFTIFFSASEVSHLFKEDIEKLWRFASRGNKAQRSIASRALFYLVEENDVVPDHIGLFGMVDDLEVLRLSMNQLEPSNLSERILSEVSGIDNSLHSLLIERTSAQFLGTSPLFAMSKSMKLLIGATRFLMGANKNRIHLVLPDKGLATLPLLCSFLLDYRFSEKQSPEWLEENGKEIFFNMKNLSVAVKYLGPAFSSGERIQGRVKIGTSGKRTK